MISHAEKTVARHCGPVLLKKKPASLFSLPPAAAEEFILVSEQERRDIAAEIFVRYPERILVFYYNPSLLSASLRDPVVSAALETLGYPVKEELKEVLSFLRNRICHEESFPHEIGFFLGYPREDVEGFMKYRGYNYKCRGQWKVYGDVGKAESLFREFRECGNALSKFIENGGSLHQFISFQ
ncbi:DUF3793 family protein [Brucepastera parasyntrophica]|uniref:DUF3793 family protein n=1 Tax=Brucepastera parasyntrophica TaxID=2880008 RepID=UPI00210E4AE7|nr:DUF3793 family protein [Brucepastera parasyntrophica]ULQ59542.1 DUF3793 family protein [Brucepastera parasyntrophica]